MNSPLSLTGATWTLDSPESLPLQENGELSEALIRGLALRGVSDSAAAERFLHPSLGDLHDPYLMQGMDVAVPRLRRAIREGEPIRVVTDYDVDGTTSSLILQATLQLLGHKSVDYHIPHRFDEGYGFSVHAAEAAAEQGVKLIVTADIGVKDHASVKRAKELGLDVLILDHHLPQGETVPEDAFAVLCPPQQSCSYPNPHLAACGVSLKLAQAMLADHRNFDLILRSMLKLAAIGTVADVVDLLNPENRAIVTLGLDALNRDKHQPGMNALLAVSGVRQGEVSASSLGFRIGPRINAAGRISSATMVIELLTCRDAQKAQRLAQELDAMNSERRNIQEGMLRTAMSLVPEDPPPFLVISQPEGPRWHRGVAGIVAARLRDRFHRPTAIIAEGPDGSATGSVRSIPEVHAVQMLERAADLFDRFGGHPAAAGFALPAERVPALRETLVEAIRNNHGDSPIIPNRRAELLLQAKEMTWEMERGLSMLAPHGKGNPRPRSILTGGQLISLSKVRGNHLRGRYLDEHTRAAVDIIWWGGGDYLNETRRFKEHEILGVIEKNHFRGQTNLRLTVEDVRPGWSLSKRARG